MSLNCLNTPPGHVVKVPREALCFLAIDGGHFPINLVKIVTNKDRKLRLQRRVGLIREAIREVEKIDAGKSKSGKQGKRKRGAKRASQCSEEPSELSAFFCARLKPFNRCSMGAKIPDTYTYPTTTWMTRTTTTLGSNADGQNAIACLPLPDSVYFNPALVLAGTITWIGGSTTAMNGSTQFQLLSAMDRTVGWGIRVTCDQAMQTAAGHVWISSVPLDYAIASGGYTWFPSTEGHFESLPLAVKIPMAELCINPVIVAGAAIDDGINRFRNYASPSTNDTGVDSGVGWTAICIMIVGAPASVASILSIEHIVHLEYVIQPNTGYFLESCAYPPNPRAIELINKVSLQAPMAMGDEQEQKSDFSFSSALNGALNTIERVADVVPKVQAIARLFFNQSVGGNNYAKMASFL